MTTYRGTLTHSELEGGFWQLVTEGGGRYVLRGDVAALAARAGLTKADGARVEVAGRVDDDAMGIAMSGPVLEVASLTAR